MLSAGYACPCFIFVLLCSLGAPGGGGDVPVSTGVVYRVLFRIGEALAPGGVVVGTGNAAGCFFVTCLRACFLWFFGWVCWGRGTTTPVVTSLVVLRKPPAENVFWYCDNGGSHEEAALLMVVSGLGVVVLAWGFRYSPFVVRHEFAFWWMVLLLGL